MSVVAAVAAMVLIGTAMFVSSGSPATTPHQTELLSMWDRPYRTVTTTMLWNAASDDAGSYSSGNDNDDTEYDTNGGGDSGYATSRFL